MPDEMAIHDSTPLCMEGSRYSPFLNNPAAIALLRQLHQPPEHFAAELQQQTLLFSLLQALQAPQLIDNRRQTGTFRETRAIGVIKQYLYDNHAENVTLAELSRISGLSPAYLCRAFTQAVGIPPHALQIAIRIDRARALLGQGFGIGHVAQRTGFYDQSHFTRHFRRLVKVSPGQYAKQVKNVQYRKRP
jgi:AraC-like DNA-binding protein